MATTSDPDIITLNCIIPGDTLEDIITVEVSKEKQVNALKPMIKKWWAYRFNRIDPSKFVLYKKIIIAPDLETKIESLDINDKIGVCLDPLDKISFYFSDRFYENDTDSDYEREEDPDYKHYYQLNNHSIHILVYPPTE